MSLAFHIESHTSAHGEAEIVSVDCEATADDPSNAPMADEIDVGSWHFREVLSDDFDGSEAVFKRFRSCMMHELRPCTWPVELPLRILRRITATSSLAGEV